MRGLQNMKGQSFGTLSTNTGQTGKVVDELLQRGWIVIHAGPGNGCKTKRKQPLNRTPSQRAQAVRGNDVA
ncbi:hypothetical protein DSLASN_27570 [Desulfoluna limicola]|uniref:Uncharacterized protein n=1 Tax=Desulfoluna limicola TaxID=2810562 RepID=A0ABN6F639_9BACT|nr:hypothetical protein DSLASN_27570 [Desulfoluna limicola]